MTLAKVVSFETMPSDMPEEWIRRYAMLINKLANADKLSYGVLGPPVFLSLAKLEGQERPYRLMFCLYVFSDFKPEELNEWLGNTAFIEEGGCGHDDWSNLP